ncbi:MAG: bifunctional salicylyl-CoA 5-hydroxylase/oxidoreductase [Planctomycetota bacterium]
MRIVSIGGGPAGLFFAILMKKAWPGVEITVHERNRPDDTFGWGVVFSDETLGTLDQADPESMARVREAFRYWDDIDTFVGGPETRVRSSGHGFCGMSRKQLLLILHERCRQLGVDLRFQSEITRASDVMDADLVLGVDGVNSRVRDEFAATFQPSIEARQCRFAWFGTDMPMDAFTFLFKETQWGLFQVHAYPFEQGLGTFIVECQDDVWRAAGLDRMDEERSAAFCEQVFAEFLHGHRILVNRSLWRRFPTITCKRWVHENVVLMGDAAHTAHFSIGSGTKLAMEDAIELRDQFLARGLDDVRSVLAAYDEIRRPEVIRVQRAAQTSLEWFENSSRYLRQDPLTFTFNLMTRSRRITYENLAKRDPGLVAAVTEEFARSHASPRRADGTAAPPMFAPVRLASLLLPNRVVVSPMCQYSAIDGVPNDWHLVHLGSRAVGGAGLVITEMTNVAPEGRISLGCAGLWNDEQERAYARIVDFVHSHSAAKIGIQLAHAGRKGSVHHPFKGGEDVPLGTAEGAWQTLAPSSNPFRPTWPSPRAMDREDMDRVRDQFVAATHRAHRAGFDLVELHMAHGYLLSSFLSPLSNRRTDEYGGDLHGRMRYPLEVFRAVREAWPTDKPLAVRISASDWAGEEGFTIDEAVVLASALGGAGADLIDVSSGGNSAEHVPVYGRMYQVPFADRIRHETGIPVMAVGGILGADHCNTVLAAGRADLCALARPHLADPYLVAHAAGHYGFVDPSWPPQYLAGRPRESN